MVVYGQEDIKHEFRREMMGYYLERGMCFSSTAIVLSYLKNGKEVPENSMRKLKYGIRVFNDLKKELPDVIKSKKKPVEDVTEYVSNMNMSEYLSNLRESYLRETVKIINEDSDEDIEKKLEEVIVGLTKIQNKETLEKERLDYLLDVSSRLSSLTIGYINF